MCQLPIGLSQPITFDEPTILFNIRLKVSSNQTQVFGRIFKCLLTDRIFGRHDCFRRFNSLTVSCNTILSASVCINLLHIHNTSYTTILYIKHNKGFEVILPSHHISLSLSHRYMCVRIESII